MAGFKMTICASFALAIACAVFPVGAAGASDGDQDKSTSAGATAGNSKVATDQAVSTPPPGMPMYKPPTMSMPTRTVGGGSRGVGDTAPALYAVVPNHVAQSASKQPSLFWYLDGETPGAAKIQFTLIDDEAIAPLIETNLAKPDRAGLHRIDLSDYDVNLLPGKEYEWSVAIVMDAKDRSQDIVATGWIKSVAASDDLKTRLSSEGVDRSVHVYAEAGLWYDALTALGDQMQRNPSDADLKEVRSSLLHQVGLDRVATAPVL
jgi:hypothetical protein